MKHHITATIINKLIQIINSIKIELTPSALTSGFVKAAFVVQYSGVFNPHSGVTEAK